MLLAVLCFGLKAVQTAVLGAGAVLAAVLGAGAVLGPVWLAVSVSEACARVEGRWRAGPAVGPAAAGMSARRAPGAALWRARVFDLTLRSRARV